jgi:diguanylate cyclase (GGDEF)-like protein
MQSGSRTIWLRSFLQPVTYLGVAFSVILLVGLTYLIHKDRQDAVEVASRTGKNLVQVFEGYMVRTIESADTTLRMLRTAYVTDPAHFDIATWAQNPDTYNDLALQLTVTGADGKILASTGGKAPKGRDISLREHFFSQVRATTDDVFISKPYVLPIRGELSIVLSRRTVMPDGSFGGIVSAALNPAQLQKFYDMLDLGKESTASLVGFDGFIRARGGGNAAYRDMIGKTVRNSLLIPRAEAIPNGTYWNDGGTIEKVKRMLTYRVVHGYPLIALVGLAESDIYQHANQNARIYCGVFFVLIAAIFAAIFYGAARERKLIQARASLTRANDIFESALANLPVGLSIYDNAQRLAISNDCYAEMYRLSPEQTKPGTPLLDIFNSRIAAGSAPKDSQEYVERGMRNARNQTVRHFDEPLADGRIIGVNLGLMPDGAWIAVHQDITARRQAEAEITQLAHYDPLTGLANRTLLSRHIGDATANCRALGIAFAVHILDLDRFKEVNDTLGHVCGDQLLAAVARRLQAVVGAQDIVARLGGDEFAILQPLSSGCISDTGVLANRILDAIASPFDLGDHKINVETSIGIAAAPGHGDEAEQLLKNADLALYRAKSEGRNTYRIFQPEMELAARERHAMQADLRGAMAGSEFELHYQPIVAADSQKICGLEALVRWRHPTRGLVPPDQFIPLAEETGLIGALGEWVLRKACFDAATWPAHLKIAVNLSSVQFRKSDLTDVVANALKESGLSPKRLELEVTESVLLQNSEENIGVLHQFRERGILVALDDFGTGYSSLSYLLSFPFDKIKIDRSFVASLGTRSESAAIVSAITGIARSMDIVTTAEGVETHAQMTMLRAAGCGQMQGYLFGRPRPKAEIDREIAKDQSAAPAGRRAASA